MFSLKYFNNGLLNTLSHPARATPMFQRCSIFVRFNELRHCPFSPFLSHPLRYSILVGIGKFEHYQQRAVWSLWSPYTYILMKAYWYYGVGRGGWGWGGKIDSLFLSSWIIPNRFWSKNKKYWLANSSFRLSHSLKEFFWIAKVNVVINMIFSNSP